MKIDYAPIQLDSAFPIRGGQPFVQSDRPITHLHIHDCLELGYCFSGSGIFMVGEKVLPFSAGDVSFINHTEVHLARSAPGTHSEWTWIYLDPMRLAGAPGAEPGRLDPLPFAGHSFGNIIPESGQPAINRVVLRMIEELRARSAGCEDALRALTWELMVLMGRMAPDAGVTPFRKDYDRLAPALQLLARGYDHPLRLAELARSCSLSVPHFRRLFRRTLGRSPRAYWNNLRLLMAGSLLRSSSRSVLQISQDVGFETLSSFNRLFRSHFGVAPREWRGKRK